MKFPEITHEKLHNKPGSLIVQQAKRVAHHLSTDLISKDQVDRLVAVHHFRPEILALRGDKKLYPNCVCKDLGDSIGLDDSDCTFSKDEDDRMITTIFYALERAREILQDRSAKTQGTLRGCRPDKRVQEQQDKNAEQREKQQRKMDEEQAKELSFLLSHV